MTSLPGCVKEGETGDTREEALANMEQAIELSLEPTEDDSACGISAIGESTPSLRKVWVWKSYNRYSSCLSPFCGDMIAQEARVCRPFDRLRAGRSTSSGQARGTVRAL